LTNRRCSATAADRRLGRRKGALLSWPHTVDLTRRTAAARTKGPGELDWHLKRLSAKFDD